MRTHGLAATYQAGCRCAPCVEGQRTYQREYKRAQRRRTLAAQRRGERRCPRMFGPNACGALLETVILSGGAMATVCPACERTERGVCLDCPAPVAGQVRRARRCARCRVAARRRQEAVYRERHRDDVNLRARRQARERARQRAEYKRAWRKANPEKVKAQKRREALRQNPKRRAYFAAWRERHRDQARARELARYHGELPLRTCVVPGCDIVVTGRKKKCTRCKAADQRLAAMALGRSA
jgi:hypothetical protein